MVKIYFKAFSANTWCAKLGMVICHVEWAVTYLSPGFYGVVQGEDIDLPCHLMLFSPVICPSLFCAVHLSISLLVLSHQPINMLSLFNPKTKTTYVNKILSSALSLSITYAPILLFLSTLSKACVFTFSSPFTTYQKWTSSPVPLLKVHLLNFTETFSSTYRNISFGSFDVSLSLVLFPLFRLFLLCFLDHHTFVS